MIATRWGSEGGAVALQFTDGTTPIWISVGQEQNGKDDNFFSFIFAASTKIRGIIQQQYHITVLFIYFMVPQLVVALSMIEKNSRASRVVHTTECGKVIALQPAMVMLNVGLMLVEEAVDGTLKCRAMRCALGDRVYLYSRGAVTK